MASKNERKKNRKMKEENGSLEITQIPLENAQGTLGINDQLAQVAVRRGGAKIGITQGWQEIKKY